MTNKEKLAKLEASLSNPNIAEAQKPSIKAAIEKLKELIEKEENPEIKDQPKGIYVFDGITYDIRKELFPEGHPILILDENSPQFKSSVIEWFADKAKTKFLIADERDMFLSSWDSINQKASWTDDKKNAKEFDFETAQDRLKRVEKQNKDEIEIYLIYADNKKENEFKKLQQTFTSLKRSDKGNFIPSSANDDKYIINKAKEAGLKIEIVDRVNDLTDLYDIYIELVGEVKEVKPDGYVEIKTFKDLLKAPNIKINIGSKIAPKFVVAKIKQQFSDYITLIYGKNKSKRVDDDNYGYSNVFIKLNEEIDKPNPKTIKLHTLLDVNNFLREIRKELQDKEYAKENINVDFIVDTLLETTISFPFLMKNKNYFNIIVSTYCKLKDIELKDVDTSEESMKEMQLSYYPDAKEGFKTVISKYMLQAFIGSSQYEATAKNKELIPTMIELFDRIFETPIVYGSKKDAKFMLHYFNSGSDVYIKELDFGAGLQDFGFVILNGDLEMAEEGYVSIQDLIKQGFELDYYYTPQTLTEIKKETKEEEKKEEEVEEQLTQFFFKDHTFIDHDNKETDLKVTAEAKMLLDRIKKVGGKNLDLGVNFLTFDIPIKGSKEFAKIGFLDNGGEFKIDVTLPGKDENRSAIVIYFDDYDENSGKSSSRRVQEIIDEAFDDIEEFIEENYKPSKKTADFKTPKEVVEIIEDTKLSDAKLDKIVNYYIAQVLNEFGVSETEISDIEEEIKGNNLKIEIKIWKNEKVELLTIVHTIKSLVSEYKDFYTHNDSDNHFVSTIPASEVETFLKKHLDELDSRSRNEIYPFAEFLKEHAETLVGEKVASKTINKIAPEKKEKLKAAYKKHVTEGKRSSKQATAKPSKKGLKLTKRLKMQGVTQEMIDTVNETGEGVLVKAVKRDPHGTAHDKAIKGALRPGKRLSVDGNIYYEYRENMSDVTRKGL